MEDVQCVPEPEYNCSEFAILDQSHSDASMDEAVEDDLRTSLPTS